MSTPRKQRPAKPAPAKTPEPATDSPEFGYSTPAAPQRTPQPQPAPPAGDGELELDDSEERAQHRMRLPEQRREQPMFEVAGPRVPRPADLKEKAPAPNFEGRVEQIWQPASEDEISGFDPAQDPAPAPRAATAPVKSRDADADFDDAPAASAPAPVTRDGKAEELADIDEFLAKTASSSPEEMPKRTRRPFSRLEWICLGSGAAVMLGLVIWLFSAVTSGTSDHPPRSVYKPDLPLEGDLITVENIVSGWRTRKDSDRVARMEIILPKPIEVLPALIPQVDFTISGSSKSGYLRFIFKDSEGKPRGDTRVVRVEGGKLVSLDNGEIITGATSGIVYSSNGLQDTSTFTTYTNSDEPRWSVEVSESATYDANDKDWKMLSLFNVRNDRLK